MDRQLTMNILEPLTLVHVPRGDEHPYRAAPFERVPRDPLAGQPVQVWAGTRPAGAAQAVRVLWRVNDGPEGSIEAEAQDEIDGATRWRATLPASLAGEKVNYRFIVEPGEGMGESHEYTAAGWVQGGRVARWEATGKGLVLELESGPRVSVSADGGVLSVRTGFSNTALEVGASRVDVREVDGVLIANVGEWRCAIGLAPYRLEIRTTDGRVVWADPAEGGFAWLQAGDCVRRLAHSWKAGPGEAFYGFGERYNAFDQRGEAIDSIVYEEYKNQGKRTYFPVPFFVSSRGYGVHLATSRRAYFDLGVETSDKATLAVDGDALHLEFFAGDPKAIVSRFVERIGKAALPPKWAFGLWMSSNEWNSQAVVAEQVALTERHGIPATALVIEAWSDESTFYIWNDAQYMPRPGAESHRLADFTFPADGLWPDPKGMVDDLHQRGVHLVLWQIPVLKKLETPHAQQDADRAHAVEAGLVVREADGDEPYLIRPFWFHDGYVPDFTSAEADRWWRAKRQYLIDDLGVDGFKTDGAEHLWGEGLKFSDGRTGAEVNNLFPNLYESVYARLGGPTRLNFSRAGYTGAQTVSTHWAGDENSTFDAFRHSITAGLTAGFSGVAFWGWDIGGFSGPLPSAELYLRATAMAAFCPIMQYHSEFNNHKVPCVDRTPWNMQDRTGDPEVLPIFRFYANLRMNLLPYIWSEAIKASRSGLPMMRALPLEFPDDERARAFPYQYLFGEALLVAPVAWEGQKQQDVYLPEGLWYDFWTGERHQGSQVLTVATPKAHIPVFVRGSTVLALRLAADGELGSFVGNAVDGDEMPAFRVYPGLQPGEFTWYADPQRPPVRFSVSASCPV